MSNLQPLSFSEFPFFSDTMKLQMKNLLFVMVLTFFFGAASYGNAINKPNDKYTKVEIYYYGWEVLTRSKLSLQTVRENYKIKITIVDEHEIEQFISWLRLEEMEQRVTQEGKFLSEDPRLVIDLFKDNKRTTYYASKFHLLSKDSTKGRKIDEKFKKKFYFSLEIKSETTHIKGEKKKNNQISWRKQ